MNRFLRLMGFNPEVHSLRNEVIAGLTIFLVMAYILALAPSTLVGIMKGVSIEQIFTSTALACAIGSLLMAFIGRVPVAIGPAVGVLFIGVNTVGGTMGYTMQFVLTAVLIEGVIFLVLSVTGLRQAIVESLPDNLKRAIALGIGLFIASLGFKNAGMLESDGLFGFLDNMVNPDHQLFCIGIVIAGFFLIRKVPGAMLYAIVITTLIGIPMGVTKIEGVFSVPELPSDLVLSFSFDKVFTVDMFALVMSLLILDIFDTIGSAIGVMSVAGLMRKNGRVPRMTQVLVSDSLATIAGSCIGMTTCTSYVESASGAAEGGRTGVTPFVVALCFFVSVFFAPIFIAIPNAATGPVLVLVGTLLFLSRQINTTDPVEFIPCFLTVIMMPLSGSIFDGIVLGVLVYAVLSSFRSIFHDKVLK